MHFQEAPRDLPGPRAQIKLVKGGAQVPSLAARRHYVTSAGGYGWIIGGPPLVHLAPRDRHIWRQQLEYTLRELGLDPDAVHPASQTDQAAFDQDFR